MRIRLVVVLLTLLTGAIQAQDVLHTGAQQLGFYTGAGISIPGGSPGNHDYWMVAGRWSRVMAEFGGGAFEYGVEIYPAMVVKQTTTVFAGGGSPLQLRYNFFSKKNKVVPYLEIGAGMLGSSAQLPETTYRFNFIDQGSLGVQWLRKGKASFQTGVRYQHISNAGLGQHNPGINSMFLFGGLSWWKK
jgi:hypothetical protein